MTVKKVLVADSDIVEYHTRTKTELIQGRRAEWLYNRLFDPVCARDNQYFLPRDQMEKNPRYKQLIPYAMFNCHGDRFVYSRKGNETRLHGSLSLGVGGHIDKEDGDFWTGFSRELLEEVSYQASPETLMNMTPYGFIVDNSNEVGQVHLGIAYHFHLKRHEEIAPQSELFAPQWINMYKCQDRIAEFETWSQLAMKGV